MLSFGQSAAESVGDNALFLRKHMTMDSRVLLLSLPAIIAFSIKILLLWYAQRSWTQNVQTRLFLYFLIAFAVHNLTEIMSFFVGANTVPVFEGFAYFAASIIVVALLTHLTVTLAVPAVTRRKSVLIVIYGYAACLEVLLLFTPLLISGFIPFEYSYSRIPGPLYFLLEAYLIIGFAGVTGLLIYGSLKQETKQKRIKCQYMLMGILPMALLVIVIVVSLHLGIGKFNSTVTLPIAITFFLLVTTYAIHQHRLFDIQFYIPWSKVRKRKTAFYNRIRAMIAEIADLDSVKTVLDRLADTFCCPVALICGQQPVMAAVSGSNDMAKIPQEVLSRIDHIVVANEIVETLPETHQVMEHHGVAAIVPFYPHSQHASGWLLLGDPFSQTVYTPLDFRIVEQLFDKMADLFLDKMLIMRIQLSETKCEVRKLKKHQLDAQTKIIRLEKENITLRQRNKQLTKEQPADGIGHVASDETEQTFAATLTLLSRSKRLLTLLRKDFPQTAYYIGPNSTIFRHQNIPDLLVCDLDDFTGRTTKRMLQSIKESRETTAFLLYGGNAVRFISDNKKALLGSMIDILPKNASNEAIIRKVTALTALRKAILSIRYPDYPLLAKSQVFNATISDVRRIAEFVDPVLITCNDTHEAISVAAYIHQLSGNQGPFKVLSIGGPDTLENLRRALYEARDGTLMIDNLNGLPESLQNLIIRTVRQTEHVRLITGNTQPEAQLLRECHTCYKLEIPELTKRMPDMLLLVYYFALQFSIQAGSFRYLSQIEVDNLIKENCPESLSALKAAVFQRLGARERKLDNNPEIEYEVRSKTLDEYVSTLEARILKQTLERCHGNKSKAARLLGLRPNTLHYKLERYGLSNVKNRTSLPRQHTKGRKARS